MLPLLLAVGCDTAHNVPPLAPVPFAACAAPVGGYEDPPDDDTTASLSGLVTATGTGDVDGCFEDAGFGSRFDADRDAGWWITAAAADGTPWTAAVAIPGDESPFSVGDAVSVAFRYFPDPGGTSLGNLEIRDAAGQLQAWVGTGASLDDLVAPTELSFATGSEIARDADHCGEWSEYDIAVTADGATVDLPYGGTAEAGGLTIRHGGYDAATDVQCSEWFDVGVALAATPVTDEAVTDEAVTD